MILMAKFQLEHNWRVSILQLMKKTPIFMENLLTRNVKNLSMCLSIINVFELVRSLKPTYTQFPFGTRACSARTTIFIYATAFVSCLLSLCPLLFNLFFLIPLFHSFMCLKLEYNHHVNYICFVLTYNAYNYITFGRKTKTAPSRASLIETPVLWLGRLCIFYALLKAGLAGSHANPLVSELKISDGNDSADLGFSKWTHAILEKPGLIELFSFWDIGNYYGVQLLDASVTKYQDYVQNLDALS
ncbi:uncharacterized protein [Arachis hypogaea]|uniref:uncharacterized protein isoform X1 n=1 Tax=Arachis hypogaea TaxID=3818 RepID=UPI000DED157F|nr:uncharacterized protein LOC112795161 isoform X2 [Arachis hypogaea]